MEVWERVHILGSFPFIFVWLAGARACVCGACNSLVRSMWKAKWYRVFPTQQSLVWGFSTAEAHPRSSFWSISAHHIPYECHELARYSCHHCVCNRELSAKRYRQKRKIEFVSASHGARARSRHSSGKIIRRVFPRTHFAAPLFCFYFLLLFAVAVAVIPDDKVHVAVE